MDCPKCGCECCLQFIGYDNFRDKVQEYYCPECLWCESDEEQESLTPDK